MKAIERFLRYVTLHTQSSIESHALPSTPGQRDFATLLAEELQQIGMEEVEIDRNGYLMATLPASPSDCDAPVIGFIAHLDTSPDVCGEGVKPRVVTYTGDDIVLNEEKQIVLSPRMFPALNDYLGQKIVVTDGSTLLGADDKAGVAAIVSAMAFLRRHPEIPHGKVRVAFTPDEEIGRSADHFRVEKFGCDWAYTVDGGAAGSLEYENFNAAYADIFIRGRNMHPGHAQGNMVNALMLGIELHESLPSGQWPECTSGYQGFYHLIRFSGTVTEARLAYLIRDHDRVLFNEKKWTMEWAVQQLNRKYADCVVLEIEDQYYNMGEILRKRQDIITLAADAMRATGLVPITQPIRGGTDGARLSFAGLPCPNIFAGGMNAHSVYEYLPVHALRKSEKTIIRIVAFVAGGERPSVTSHFLTNNRVFP